MRGDDQRSGPVFQRCLEDLNGLDVEMVGRLVEEKAGGSLMRDYRQLRAGPLAGRQRRDSALGYFGVEAEGGQRRAGWRLAEPG